MYSSSVGAVLGGILRLRQLSESSLVCRDRLVEVVRSCGPSRGREFPSVSSVVSGPTGGRVPLPLMARWEAVPGKAASIRPLVNTLLSVEVVCNKAGWLR